ncbi:MAG: DUF4625 domain-containing protein [Bacteroidaceae bacterium]|nr:DUF4625 domain-containing protein [Bacteroidaceae bacterium]
MIRKSIYSLLLVCTFAACSSDEETLKDMTYPEISLEGYTYLPSDCDVYMRGDTIPVRYLLTDNVELGSYNIEIHHNFTHHTHSTSSVECPLEAIKKAENPWVYNYDSQIPAGMSSYNLSFNIPIPSNIDPGDYHFMLRLTDKAGWTQLHAVAIKVI